MNLNSELGIIIIFSTTHFYTQSQEKKFISHKFCNINNLIKYLADLIPTTWIRRNDGHHQTFARINQLI